MPEGASSLNRKVSVVVQEPNQSASEQKPANSDEQSGGISFIDNPAGVKNNASSTDIHSSRAYLSCAA